MKAFSENAQGSRKLLLLLMVRTDAGASGPALGSTTAIDAFVLGLAVARRERRDDLVRARNRLGVDHDGPWILVAEVDRLPRAVGIDDPQMVIMHLAAVDVFPAGIEDASVGQRPRRVVVLDVAGELADVLALAVAAVQHRHLGQPAVHPAFAAARNEHDAAIGQVAGLDVVPGAVGQLAQPAAVGVDLDTNGSSRCRPCGRRTGSCAPS